MSECVGSDIPRTHSSMDALIRGGVAAGDDSCRTIHVVSDDKLRVRVRVLGRVVDCDWKNVEIRDQEGGG